MAKSPEELTALAVAKALKNQKKEVVLNIKAAVSSIIKDCTDKAETKLVKKVSGLILAAVKE